MGGTQWNFVICVISLPSLKRAAASRMPGPDLLNGQSQHSTTEGLQLTLGRPRFAAPHEHGFEYRRVGVEEDSSLEEVKRIVELSRWLWYAKLSSPRGRSAHLRQQGPDTIGSTS